jgi:hypothetical protein
VLRFAALLTPLAGFLAASLMATTGCSSHGYRVEQRDVPVHVWLTAPELALAGGSIPALVYVGSQKVVEGNVTFEPGKATVALPTAYVRAGSTPVSAVLGDGAMSANDTFGVEGESWLQITVRGRTASLRLTERQPHPAGR